MRLSVVDMRQQDMVNKSARKCTKIDSLDWN